MSYSLIHSLYYKNGQTIRFYKFNNRPPSMIISYKPPISLDPLGHVVTKMVQMMK